MELKITFDLLPVLGALLPLICWLVPGFKTWFDALQAERKQLLTAGILLMVAVGASGLSYAGLLHVYPGPDLKEFITQPLVDYVFALMTMAGVYKSGNYIFATNKPKPKGPSILR